MAEFGFSFGGWVLVGPEMFLVGADFTESSRLTLNETFQSCGAPAPAGCCNNDNTVTQVSILKYFN